MKTSQNDYDWIDPSLGWKPLDVPELPPRLILDLATKCNLRCGMCPVWGQDDDTIENAKGTMNLEAARRLLDELMSAKPLVSPCLYGEPLLAPDFKTRIMDMKSRGLSVFINTNGLALTSELAQFFVDIELDSVFVSIDSVTKETLKKIRGIDKLEKIESAVFRLLRARGDRDWPRIGVSFTAQDENRHEQEAFVRRWTGIVDCVRTGLVFENGTFPDMARLPERKPCPAIYKTMAIHHDGQVTVCCLDGLKSTNLGNVFKEGGKAVWNGEAFTKVRYYHETGQWDKVPFCKPCNGWAQYDFEETIKDGILIRRSPEYTYYNRIDRLKTWQGSLLSFHAPALEVLEEV